MESSNISNTGRMKAVPLSAAATDLWGYTYMGQRGDRTCVSLKARYR